MKEFITMVFLFMLFIPLAMILSKLVGYLDANDFKEWWATLLWILIAPFTLVIMGMWRNDKE